MSSTNGVNSLLGGASAVSRFLPEPKSRVANVFSGVLRAASSVLSPGLSGGIDPNYQEMINKQIETQQQMQLVSLVSNVEKSKHETQMAAIRNLRAG